MPTLKSTKATTDARVHRKQRGDFLLESLIGMVLMAIIGMGVVNVTSKVNKSQRDFKTHSMLVDQMRAQLILNSAGAVDLCANPPQFRTPNDEQLLVEIQGCTGTARDMETAQITVNGQATTIPNIPAPLFISVTSESLGQIVVGGTWPEEVTQY